MMYKNKNNKLKINKEKENNGLETRTLPREHFAQFQRDFVEVFFKLSLYTNLFPKLSLFLQNFRN